MAPHTPPAARGAPAEPVHPAITGEVGVVTGGARDGALRAAQSPRWLEAPLALGDHRRDPHRRRCSQETAMKGMVAVAEGEGRL